ncbi:hypothetical protein WJX75_001294 [Coccomyxa subellipsoidea]|uniref:Uncharacterized protein n=1 Tax=Coccomyxa subellipsoidea TaxID=248742 RepID=A0ABR2YUW6_9CHLO
MIPACLLPSRSHAQTSSTTSLQRTHLLACRATSTELNDRTARQQDLSASKSTLFSGGTSLGRPFPRTFRIHASPSSSADDAEHRIAPHTTSVDNTKEEGGPSIDFKSLGLVAVVMTFGVFNRILYKMALVPLGDYIFFLAQFQTFSYVVVYFTALLIRYRSGIVTKDMIAAPNKKLFLWIGGLEAVSQLLGFIGAAKLPGVVLPLLQQTLLVWQVLLAYLILNKRLDATQIAGAGVVIAGVLTAAWPSEGSSSVFSEISPVYAAVYVASMLFPALATIFKEKIFNDAKQKLGGKQLDIFVVNSFGSAAQAAFVFLLLPGLAALRGINPSELPQYLTEGFQCLRGITPDCAGDCSKAPLIATAYVACNLGLNISLLALLRQAGNVVQSLSMQTVIPLTIWAFTFPWPLLDPSPPLGSKFVLGTGIMLSGLLTYNSAQWLPVLQKKLGRRKGA